MARPSILRDGERVQVFPSAEDAETALGERIQAFDQLCLVGRRVAVLSADLPALSELQRCILEALQEAGPMRTEELCAKAGYKRRTLFKERGVKELRKLGLVVNDRRAGGYDLTPAGKEYLARYS
jgi:hypothetical protein